MIWQTKFPARQSDSEACVLDLQTGSLPFWRFNVMIISPTWTARFILQSPILAIIWFVPSNNSGKGILLHISIWWNVFDSHALSTPPSGSLSLLWLSSCFLLPLRYFIFNKCLALLVSYLTAIHALLPSLYTNRPFMTCLLRLISCHLASCNLGSSYSEKPTVCWIHSAFSCLYISAICAQVVVFA